MLNLYRRHRDQENGKCEGGHNANVITYQSDELRRKAKKCACPVYASGTLATGGFKRRNLGTPDWDQAKLRADVYEQARSWGEVLPAVPASTAAPVTTHVVLINAALDAWIAEYESRVATAEGARNTAKRVRYFASRVKSWCHVKGYYALQQLGQSELQAFRGSWAITGPHVKAEAKRLGVSAQDVPSRPLKPNTRRSYTTYLRLFFEYCVFRTWIPTNVALLVKDAPGKRKSKGRMDEQKFPYTEEEIERMLIRCDGYECKMYDGVKFTGDDIRDFINVSVDTGLRISDMVSLRPGSMTAAHRLDVVAIKNGRRIIQKLDPDIVEIFQRRGAKGNYIFGDHTSDDIVGCWTATWRNRLDAFWKTCGPWEYKPTPHRFRHTFARRLLEQGYTTFDVAQLLGDEEPTIRKYYAAWVKERQDRLDSILDARTKRFRGTRKLQLVKAKVG